CCRRAAHRQPLLLRPPDLLRVAVSLRTFRRSAPARRLEAAARSAEQLRAHTLDGRGAELRADLHAEAVSPAAEADDAHPIGGAGGIEIDAGALLALRAPARSRVLAGTRAGRNGGAGDELRGVVPDADTVGRRVQRVAQRAPVSPSAPRPVEPALRPRELSSPSDAAVGRRRLAARPDARIRRPGGCRRRHGPPPG